MRQDTGNAVVDHLKFVIGPPERRRRSVWYIVYEDDGQAHLHFPVDEVSPEPTLDDCVKVSDVFAEAIQTAGAEASLVVAITRPGPASVTASDRLWYRAAQQVCAERQVPLLGVHVMTAAGHRQIFLDDVL